MFPWLQVKQISLLAFDHVRQKTSHYFKFIFQCGFRFDNFPPLFLPSKKLRAAMTPLYRTAKIWLQGQGLFRIRNSNSNNKVINQESKVKTEKQLGEENNYNLQNIYLK